MEENQTEIAKEFAVATLKAAIGKIPFVGSLMADLLFDLRGRIKQNRINEFIESLAEYADKSNSLDLKFDKIISEEFGDIMEKVVHMAARTRSTKKSDLFRQVIVNHMISDISAETSEFYLEIIDRITEKQVLILDGLNEAFGSFYPELHRKEPYFDANWKLLKLKRKERDSIFRQKRTRGNLSFG